MTREKAGRKQVKGPKQRRSGQTKSADRDRKSMRQSRGERGFGRAESNSFNFVPRDAVNKPDEVICGRNAVNEAIAAGRTINRLHYADQGDSRLHGLVQTARDAGISVSLAKSELLERLSGGLPHQGVVAELAAKDYVNESELLAKLEAEGKQPFVLILDEIQDGHNLGAILRVADAAGVDLVVIPERRSQALDARVAKASAGAIEYVPVARVVNLSRLILDLKDQGYWIFGLAGEGESDYDQVSYRGKIALVVGNEGKGLAKKLRDHCDYLVKIPMAGRINSLNASVACGIVAFAAKQQRG